MTESQSRLKQFFFYDPDTGLFQRIAKITVKGKIMSIIPREPQSITHYGYRQVNYMGRPYPIHRLIFLYMEGDFPPEDVDHINGDRLDNRWCNLRKVTRRENLMNVGVRPDNSTGYNGISLRSDTNMYHTYIEVKGKRVQLGNFMLLRTAIRVREKALREHDFHINHGKRKSWSRK